MSKRNGRTPAQEVAAMRRGLSSKRKGRLFDLMRPSELQRLLDREQFLALREAFLSHVSRNALDVEEISVGIGLNPKSLATGLSESMVYSQLRYNLSMLARAWEYVGMKVPRHLERYLSKGRSSAQDTAQ